MLPAYNVGPTVTAPSHATLVTGAYQAFANLPVDGEANTYVPDYPTLF